MRDVTRTTFITYSTVRVARCTNNFSLFRTFYILSRANLIFRTFRVLYTGFISALQMNWKRMVKITSYLKRANEFHSLHVFMMSVDST